MVMDISPCHVALLTLAFHFASPLTCPPGTFLYTIVHTGEEFCIECQDGSFVPYDDHQQTLCRPCEEIKDPKLEILISPCNKTHDAVIHCVDGYYRDEARNPRETGQCKKCTECPAYTGRTCGTYRDAICCWNENDDVVSDGDGALKCIERPWYCRQGQYFDTRDFYCLPCPDNTFMPLDYHIQTQCWKCNKESKPYRPLHSVIIQPCNSTHAPVIRCEDGFFIDPNMGRRNDATGCSPCTDCSTKTDAQYEGRKCDGMEDTVCCPQPNMTVVDTSDGAICKAPLIQNRVSVCDEGLCPHQSGGNRFIDCAPCPLSNKADHFDDTDAHLANANESPTDHNGAKETVSNNDQESSGGLIPLYLFVGIVTGLVLSLACYLIYRKLYRHKWRRRWVTRKRSRSEMDKRTEPADFDESEPLEIKISETHSTSRRRQVDVLSKETKQEQHKLSRFSMHQVTTDDHGSEQCCGNESDLHSKRELCKNVKDHERFISAKIFQIDDLPEHFREDGKLAYINAVCDLTVRLKVNHTSIDRPKNYPCHELRGPAGAGIKRFGTGLVFKVTKKFAENNNGNPCPCRACSVYPEGAEEMWAEFEVVTAAHVVYNNEECERMSCKLWFDDDDDFKTASSLNGWRVKETGSKSDFRIMHCITHDGKVSQELEEKITHLENLRKQYDRTSTTESERLAVLISHQHALSKRISVGKATYLMDGDIEKWRYDVQACPGSCGAPVCLLGMRQKDILVTVHNMENESTGFYL